MYVVAGATGKTGTVVVRTLLAAGKQVQGLIRSGERLDPTSHDGLAYRALSTLADSAAVAAALEGAKGAYFILPTDMRSDSFLADACSITEAIATAVERSGVPHVVLLSSIGAHRAQGTGPIVALHNAERRLDTSGVRLSIVRAALFLENWGAVAAAARAGTLPTFLPPKLVYPTVAAVDIGRTVARTLLDGPAASGRRVIELAGVRDMSGDDIAAVFARLLGRDVTAQQIPPNAIASTLQGLGISADISRLYAELYNGLAYGDVAWERSGTRFMRGTTPAEEVLKSFV